ncbi:MAG: hypothetical protein JKY19_01420 [Alcanivoracaceae bacterium]|nr:hypothetical protein [Alcanivoracaceae bacterium]
MSDRDNSKNLISANSICSLLNFSGENTLDFLNNLLISNLIALSENTYQYTALCNPKGRIIASMWVKIINAEQINIICPTNMSEHLINFFNMRKFRLKINISQPQDDIIINTRNFSIFSTDKTNKQIELASKETFYEAFFNKNLPWIDCNNTENFIPQHVNLDLHENTMSFTKGCYPGQEIIARIKYLGTIKKRMILLSKNNEKALLDSAEKLQAVSPIIHNRHKNQFFIQVIAAIK